MRDDTGLKVMGWMSTTCLSQKPKRLRPKRVYLSEGVGHALVESVLTDVPQTAKEVAQKINRSRNRSETILRQLVVQQKAKPIPDRPMKFVRLK